MYDASLGRFPSLDPLADKFHWVSPYNYVENSPISNIDWWGLQAELVIYGELVAASTATSATTSAHATNNSAAHFQSDVTYTMFGRPIYEYVDRAQVGATILTAKVISQFSKKRVRSANKTRSYSEANKINQTNKQKNSNNKNNNKTKKEIAFGTGTALAFEAYINMKSTINESWSTPELLPDNSTEDQSNESDSDSSDDQNSSNSNGTDSNSKDSKNEDSKVDFLNTNDQIQPSDNTQPSTYGYY